MGAHPVNKTLSYAGQALGYTAFIAVLAYFSTSPPYRHLPPDTALVKVSLQHAGQRKDACRERSAEGVGCAVALGLLLALGLAKMWP